MPYYDEIELGDEIGPVEKVATDDEVSNFCDVWGAPTPNRFTNAEVAAKSGMKGTIVPGIMTMAMSTITSTYITLHQVGYWYLDLHYML